MKKASTDLGLLLMRLGFSVGMMTHGYGKFLKVIQGNFNLVIQLELDQPFH